MSDESKINQKQGMTPAKENVDVAEAVVVTPKNPSSILASTVTARTLTISDQHATILLTSKGGEEEAATAISEEAQEEEEEKKPVVRSLLKLTLVPFHKTSLSHSIPQEGGGANDPTVEGKNEKDKKTVVTTEEQRLGGVSSSEEEEDDEKRHTERTVEFLNMFDWRMTSESGAEYSYFEAFLKKPNNENDDADVVSDDGCIPPKAKRARTTTTTEEPSSSSSNPPLKMNNKKCWSHFKAELISPASSRQIDRAMPSPGLVMITETPQLYQKLVKPVIDSIISRGSLSWIENVISGKKEKERLLHDAPGWMMNIDTKWRTHPDALTTPREEWMNHESVVDLYCLAIFKKPLEGEGEEDSRAPATLRDLTRRHLPTLREILVVGPQVIQRVYGVHPNQLRVYVHYQPQFYHFHVHLTRLQNEVGCQVERGHLVSDIIQNLELKDSFYRDRTMVYKLSRKEKLCKLFLDELKKEEEKEESDVVIVNDSVASVAAG